MIRVSRVTTVAVTTLLAGFLALAAAPTAQSAVPTRPHLEPTTFTISSFNVLGASHTKHSRHWDVGSTRIKRVNRLLERHAVDVAGFQEMQPSQASEFLDLTDGGWALWPGNSRARLDSDNSIGWRTDKFELVEADLVPIPYFDGHPRNMPLVLLRSKQTGMMAYVANYHNPADTGKHRHQQKWRTRAIDTELALQREIYGRGVPRFLTGDMNERSSFVCRALTEAPLIAARPTTYLEDDGSCHADRPRAVDWILGARKVSFSNYDEDRSALVGRTTDHPVITATVTVDPDRLPRAWNVNPPRPFVP